VDTHWALGAFRLATLHDQAVLSRHWWAAPDEAPHDISVVIPAFNEASRIAPTLRDVVEHLRKRRGPFEVIVVDDGSSDATVDVVRSIAVAAPEVSVVSFDTNKGKGAAVRHGVLRSTGALVAFVDADGATPIAELDRLVDAVHGGAGVAVGSRVGSADGIDRVTKLHRRVMGRVFHAVVAMLVPAPVRDTQCGFKLMTRPAADAIFERVQSDGFSFDVEVLTRAAQAGVPIVELAVSWTDVPTSRVRLVRDSAAMLVDVVAIRRRIRRDPWTGPMR
jgi:dolichyl-phosphate beta-glucosyltransferase